MLRRLFLTACVFCAALPLLQAQEARFITVASTTSTVDSGLFSYILPIFKAKTGIEVRVLSQGTGQALDTGRRGDADVVLVHAKVMEEKFVTEGFSAIRKPLMYNDFILVGSVADPAKVLSAKDQPNKDIAAALQKIATIKAPFVSRGDRSGTHQAELALWKAAGVDLAAIRGEWYREIGQGMGAALNLSSAMGAYVLADRATWLNFKNREGLQIVVEGDTRLFNQYGIMLVNPQKHPHVKAQDGQLLIDWLIGAEGQKAIGEYKINGQSLFVPNAHQIGA